MRRAMSICLCRLLQANVLIRGVVVSDGLFLIANWIIWLIQTWKFDVLLKCQHSNISVYVTYQEHSIVFHT